MESGWMETWRGLLEVEAYMPRISWPATWEVIALFVTRKLILLGSRVDGRKFNSPL